MHQSQRRLISETFRFVDALRKNAYILGVAEKGNLKGAKEIWQQGSYTRQGFEDKRKSGEQEKENRTESIITTKRGGGAPIKVKSPKV